jgi:hypothetical protein
LTKWLPSKSYYGVFSAIAEIYELSHWHIDFRIYFLSDSIFFNYLDVIYRSIQTT